MTTCLVFGGGGFLGSHIARGLIEKGYKRLELTETPEIKERVEYELAIIFNKGYTPYFLVVGDLLHYAREKNILSILTQYLMNNRRL